jgi:hypothetical protein
MIEILNGCTNIIHMIYITYNLNSFYDTRTTTYSFHCHLKWKNTIPFHICVFTLQGGLYMFTMFLWLMDRKKKIQMKIWRIYKYLWNLLNCINIIGHPKFHTKNHLQHPFWSIVRIFHILWCVLFFWQHTHRF